MKMIKLTEEHYIVVNDSEIKECDWCMYNTGEIIQYLVKLNTDNLKKITHSTQPLNTNFNDWFDVQIITLSEVKELLGVVDVEKKANKQWGNVHRTGVLGYIEGYNQCLEDNKDRKYTQEDMLTIRNELIAFLLKGDVTALDRVQAISKFTKWFDEYVESLQPKAEWEVEFVDGKLKLKS